MEKCNGIYNYVSSYEIFIGMLFMFFLRILLTEHKMSYSRLFIIWVKLTDILFRELYIQGIVRDNGTNGEYTRFSLNNTVVEGINGKLYFK